MLFCVAHRSRLAICALTASTSLIAISFATHAFSADVTISSGTTSGAIAVTDGSTLTVEKDGTITDAADTVTDAVDGTSITIKNSGNITSTGGSAIDTTDSSLTLTNSGSIDGNNFGVFGSVVLKDLMNSGTITGVDTGVAYAEISNLTNTGTISSTAGDGINAGTIGSISNSGLIKGAGGGDGIYLSFDLTSLTNTGTIIGSVDGVYAVGTAQSIVNSGTIKGARIGVYAGEITSLINSGTIIGETLDGVSAGCSCGISYLNNSGTITGDRDAVSAETITSLINSGTVSGGADGVFASTSITALINSGTITGGDDGVYADLLITSLANSGYISGVDDGVQTAELGTLTNSGTITGVDDGIDVDLLGTITNTGAIIGGTLANSKGIDANFGTIINSGTITGYKGIEFDRTTAGNATVTNNGTISSTAGATGLAIDFQDTGSDTLNLQLNSILIGAINLDGTNDTLNVAPEMSARVTFSTLPDNINLSSRITDITGTTVTQVDTTFIGAIDDLFVTNLSNVSTGIFGHLNSPQSEGSPNSNGLGYNAFASAGKRTSWTTGWAGVGEPDNTSSSMYVAGGLSVGTDFTSDNGDIYGLLIGNGVGHTKIGDDLGHDVHNLAYYGGVYSRLHRDSFVADFNFQGGYLDFDSQRHIANNALTSGREKASASYHGYYAAPTIKLSKQIDHGTGYFMIPSISLGYAAIYVDDYAEAGSTSNISVGSRLIHKLSSKAEVAYVVDNVSENGTNYRMQSFAGIEGIFGFGDATTATATLFNTSTTFDPGGSQNSVRGFAGIRLNVEVTPKASFSGSIELGYNNSGKVSASTDINLGIKF